MVCLLKRPASGAALDTPLTVNGVALINHQHGVSKNFTPKVSTTFRLIAEADAAYAAMVKDAKRAGLTIVWRVGYRSYATQKALSANPPPQYGDDGDSYVAPPGHSEHQAGLAVDVGSPSGRGVSFPKTKEFAWLRANSDKDGFVLRYPAGKTEITGYHIEPWHYRYIGPDAAAAFGPNSTLTLEEYLGGR